MSVISYFLRPTVPNTKIFSSLSYITKKSIKSSRFENHETSKCLAIFFIAGSNFLSISYLNNRLIAAALTCSLSGRCKMARVRMQKRPQFCGSHAVNWPAAALSMNQMLEWQCGCRSCCFFRSRAVVLLLLLLLLLYFFLLMLLLLSPLSLWQRGITGAPTAMHLLAAVWGGQILSFCECQRERQREGRAQWKEEAVRVSFLVFGWQGWWRYHAGHLCRGLWDQTQLNTQWVNRDPRSLFFSHRVQRCVLVLW